MTNFTTHSFFNLSGNSAAEILDHVIYVNAGRFLPIDKSLIPTGKLETVDNTPMDFRTPTTFGARIKNDYDQLKLANGYDHHWVLDKSSPNELSLAATAWEPKSGRFMAVYTTEPGMQVHTGNNLEGKVPRDQGKGSTFIFRSGFNMEPSRFPDSPEQAGLPHDRDQGRRVVFRKNGVWRAHGRRSEHGPVPPPRLTPRRSQPPGQGQTADTAVSPKVKVRPQEGGAMASEDEVRRASEQFYAALNRMLNGDAGPLAAIWAHGLAVTTMHPIGGREVGWGARARSVGERRPAGHRREGEPEGSTYPGCRRSGVRSGHGAGPVQTGRPPGHRRGARHEYLPAPSRRDPLFHYGSVRMPWILWNSPVKVRPREWAARPGSLREVCGVTQSTKFPDERSQRGARNLAGRSVQRTQV